MMLCGIVGLTEYAILFDVFNETAIFCPVLVFPFIYIFYPPD